MNPTGKAAAANDSEQARNDELASRLFDFQKRHELSDDQLGKKLGNSGTYVSRYRNHRQGNAVFTGDLFKFESAVLELLTKEELMEGDATRLSSEGFCVHATHRFLDFVTVNRMLSVGHGPAGKGKTCAARLHTAKHSRNVYLHLWDWTAGRDRLISALASAARVRRANGESYAEALVRTFRDSERLIVIDNFQRATERSRKFLVDFYDATRTPIALIGNPEIVTQFRKNDQHFSRLGRCCDITKTEAEMLADTNKRTVFTLLETNFPAALNDKEAQSRALEVLRTPHGGASRTVRSVLRLAECITRSEPMNPADAIRLAETQLAREAA